MTGGKQKAKKRSLRRGKVNRKHKDTLFRYIFKNKEELLSLYNALSGKTYDDPAQLEITTLENVIYIHMKNDVSFLVDNELNLYEHQSSFNPNMPLRGLFYLSVLYRELVEESRLYSTRRIPLPTPHYVVFYNGVQDMPDYRELRLSEAFLHSGQKPDVEVVAHMYNINYGHNQELMEKCHKLWEYSYFMERLRQYQKTETSLERAVQRAVSDCVGQGILKEILEKERAAVMGFILEEFDQKGYEKVIREDGYLEGVEAGIAQGLEQGEQQSKREMILNMFVNGISMEQIVQITRMPEEEIRKIVEK